ncbi:MAG: helicase-exonuclease AddAB subunit AddA [bacterium]|nr:helicase-exonuclease AddAB subunit AddA [bacterium]MCM1376540.1 helicase-exonuclease AddAB subunit AddA [Muribaculum sp.]
MSIQFTPDQQKVIDLRERNILVSAAAGSGKTAVLVERILCMICDGTHPVDVDRLLIVTFTNAAAAEMRERIRMGLERRLEEQPDNVHLERQATLLHNALITTIHSFCLYLIRNHFQEIGLDPAMRVADEGESRLLREDVLRELLEEHFAGGDADFAECVEFFCPGGREKALEQHILKLHEYAESCPWPEQWLEERKSDYVIPDRDAWEQSACGRYLRQYMGKMVQGCVDTLEQALELCREPDGPYMYEPLLERERDMLRQISQDMEGLETVCFERLPVKKDPAVSAGKRELVKALRSDVKDTLKELREQFLTAPVELSLARMNACQGPVRTLIELAEEFGRAFRTRKQEKKLMDFSDIEHYALEILLRRQEGQILPSPVAREYREYFQEILTDEYQDSNLVQEYLLWAVSGEEEGRYNRFMVGDVKQSIYKFRLARPELFLEKYDTYTQDESVRQRIDLSRNFRSRREVLDTVNGVFANLMSRDRGGIEYDDRAALYLGADYPAGEDYVSELLLTSKPEKGSGESARAREARMIAARILRLRREGLVTDRDTGQLRPARYEDMVILLRTSSGWDEEFKEVLEAEGIPVHIASKTGYFAATEVQELLQLLRVLDNPTQDIPLFGVMKSVFGGFDEEEIALLRSGRQDVSLWAAVKDWVAEASRGEVETEEAPQDEAGARKVAGDKAGEADQATAAERERDRRLWEKCRRLVDRIDTYRGYTVYMPIRQLLETILREHDYLQYVTAMPAGSRRRANVEMLLTKASDFEKTSYFGLFHFVRYIEQLEKYEVDFGEAGALDEHADVVRIMSIHKSKGLEFPIVFVSGLAKRFNMQDVNQTLLMDMDYGLGTDYVDPAGRVRDRTLRRLVLSCKLREENLAEELRVLYVALTRAREKLIMTACVTDAQELCERCGQRPCGPISYLAFMKAGSYLEEILSAHNPANVQITVWREEDMARETVRRQIDLAEKELLLEQAETLADPAQVQALKQRFAYTYAYRHLEQLYTKTSVSELKIAAMEEKDEAAYQAFEEKEVVPYVPVFRQGVQEAGGAMRGNAFHKVMELADYEALYHQVFETMPESGEEFIQTGDRERLRANLRELLGREVAEGRMPESYLPLLNENQLLRFFQDPIAWRMWRADRAGLLYREQPFVYGISASRLRPQFPEGEKVLIQGIIDAFFIEEGQIVIVDYKTDRVRTGEELWNRYAEQLKYYEEALGKLMQLPVGEKLLYSSRLGCCVTEPVTA